MKIPFLLMIGLSLLTSPVALAADRAQLTQLAPASPRLIMLPFENHLKDQDPAISLTALDSLQTELLKPQSEGQSVVFRLLDQREVSAKIKELALNEQGLASSDRALELGRRLDAGLLLSGKVSAGKIHTSEVTRQQPTRYTWATIQVHVTVTDVASGELLFSSQATGKSGLYPTWKSERFTSLILEAVAAASKDLAGQVRSLQRG